MPKQSQTSYVGSKLVHVKHPQTLGGIAGTDLADHQLLLQVSVHSLGLGGGGEEV